MLLGLLVEAATGGEIGKGAALWSQKANQIDVPFWASSDREQTNVEFSTARKLVTNQTTTVASLSRGPAAVCRVARVRDSGWRESSFRPKDSRVRGWSTEYVDPKRCCCGRTLYRAVSAKENDGMRDGSGNMHVCGHAQRSSMRISTQCRVASMAWRGASRRVASPCIAVLCFALLCFALYHLKLKSASSTSSQPHKTVL